jgi:hypothetical protein
MKREPIIDGLRWRKAPPPAWLAFFHAHHNTIAAFDRPGVALAGRSDDRCQARNRNFGPMQQSNERKIYFSAKA